MHQAYYRAINFPSNLYPSMSSSEVIKSLILLLTSIALMMIGFGMFSTFISLRMEIEGFPRQFIGYQASAFYAGVVLGSLFCSKVINRVGHIRAFAIFCGASASCILVFPFLKFVSVWILLRGILGFCLAGLYMVSESWLNARTTRDTRGSVLAAYMMVINFSFAAGQLLLNFADTAGPELFMIGAALYALALIPVSLTRSAHPDPVESHYFGIKKLFSLSPVAMVGCIVNGLVLGSLLSLSPVFIKEIGFDVATVSIFMTVFMISGLFMQFPVGKLSDMYDRRYVIAGASAVLFLATIPLMVFSSPGITLLYILAILMGGTTQTLYPLCISYANDFLKPEELVKASGGLVMAYGIGAAIGPALAGLLMEHTTPSSLFYYVGVVVLSYILYVFYRIPKREAPTEKDSFIAMPDATASTGGLAFDPRCDDDEEPAPAVAQGNQ